MTKDLNIIDENNRLNVRVGVIARYLDNIIIEITTENFSVIPGGRIKFNEKSSLALKREMKEEINLDIDENRLKKLEVFENFFVCDNKNVHEIYFLYEYNLNESEFNRLKNLKNNLDNKNNYFKFINQDEIEKYNLLPKFLRGKILKKN